MGLGAAINRLITERGWETPAAVGGVMGRWPRSSVTTSLHCVRRSTTRTSASWSCSAIRRPRATQVRMLAPQLVRRLNEDPGTAPRGIDIKNPGSGARRYGPLRAQSTGHDDTYEQKRAHGAGVDTSSAECRYEPC